MARLFIQTPLKSVCIVGEFCGWEVDKAIRVERQKDRKMLCVHDMPSGEYRVLSCKSYHGGEIYPTSGKQMPNRYFGTNDETITAYFEKI